MSNSLVRVIEFYLLSHTLTLPKNKFTFILQNARFQYCKKLAMIKSIGKYQVRIKLGKIELAYKKVKVQNGFVQISHFV